MKRSKNSRRKAVSCFHEQVNDLRRSCGNYSIKSNSLLSHVIQAIFVPQEYAHGTIRITLGMDNTADQVDRIAQQIASILR